MRNTRVDGYRSLAGALCVAAAMALGGACGCTGSAATTEPADAALNDPMNYTPNIPKSDMSGTGTMDTKAFDKDLNDLVNP